MKLLSNIFLFLAFTNVALSSVHRESQVQPLFGIARGGGFFGDSLDKAGDFISKKVRPEASNWDDKMAAKQKELAAKKKEAEAKAKETEANARKKAKELEDEANKKAKELEAQARAKAKEAEAKANAKAKDVEAKARQKAKDMGAKGKSKLDGWLKKLD